MRRFSNHKSWVRAVVGLAMLALLATGCIRAEIDISVEDDGSGEVELLSALDTDSLLGVFAELDIPEESAGSSDDLCNEFRNDAATDSGFPADAVTVPYDEDGFCGTVVTYSLEASTDQSLAIEPLFDGEARLFKEGDNWIFDVPVDLSDITEGSDAGDLPDDMFESIFEDASFKITLDLPGRATDGENNATSVGADGQFEWDIDFLDPPDRIFAQTEPGSGGGNGGGFPWWILGLLVILGLAGFAAFRFMNRNTDDAASSLDGFQQPAGDLSVPGGEALADGAQQPVVEMPPQAPGASHDYVAPVQPSNPSAQETVMLDTGATAAAAPSETASVEAAASDATAKPAPTFDEALGAWIVDHPQHGRLAHDTETDTWRPV